MHSSALTFACFPSKAETLEYVVEQGVPRAKVHMGIPLYGQTFTLAGSNTGLGAEANARGKPAKFTNQAGMMAFFEICAGGKNRGYV